MLKFFKNPNYTLLALAILIFGAIIVALIIGENKPKKPAAHNNVVSSSCGPYRKDGVMEIDNQKVNVEIAYSDAAKEKGLSGRPCILADQGMLFDFGRDGRYEIWMKDMKFPIDVVWITSAHRVAAIEIDFQPSTYNKQQPEKSEKRANQIPARYVLELKAHRSQQLHMQIGTPVNFQKTQSV